MDDLQIFKDRLKEIGISDWLEDWDFKNISEEVGKLQSGQIYLEIGVAFGVSASLALLSSQIGVKVIGIDNINWTIRNENIHKLLLMYGALEKINNWKFIESDSDVIGRYWKEGFVDCLFIDGDHTYKGVMADMALWIPWVKHGGVIMFDDYNDKTGVKQAVNEVLRDHKAFSDHRIDGEMYICRKI